MNTNQNLTTSSSINELAAVCQLKVVAIKGLCTLIVTSNNEFFTIYDSPCKGFCVKEGDTPHDVSIARFRTMEEAMRFISTY